MKSRRQRREQAGYRPSLIRIDEDRCTECGVCLDIAPSIRVERQRIPVERATLDAMAECPSGALVWRESAGEDESGAVDG